MRVVSQGGWDAADQKCCSGFVVLDGRRRTSSSEKGGEELELIGGGARGGDVGDGKDNDFSYCAKAGKAEANRGVYQG